MTTIEGARLAEPAVAVPCVDEDWLVDPASGWSRDELEGLLAAGVRVVVTGEEPVGADAGDGRLEQLEHPEHGPVAWLAERAPSGGLLTDLERWAAAEVVTDYDALEVVAQWHRLEAYCAAGKRLAAAELARRDALAGGLAHLEGQDVLVGEVSIAADELAMRIGVTKPVARRLVRSGRCLNGAGLLTAEALEQGEIDAVKADAICEAIQDLGADAALAVQERVLAKAGFLSAGGVRRELALACAAVEPVEFEDRGERAGATRRVDRPRVLPHGMASVYAVLPAVEATQLYRALDAAARSGKAGGDPRTLDQLRADALAAMGAAALATGWIGPAPGGGESPGGVEANAGGSGVGTSGDGSQLADSAGDPGAGPLHCGPMRVGVIGGRTAHMRVVVPMTMLLDAESGAARDGPARPGAPPGDHPPGAEGRDDSETVRARPDGDGRAAGSRGGGTQERTGGLAVHDGAWPDLLGVARLEGYGPIPASAARALAAGNPWARMVVDPVDRTVLELSKARYQPPQSMVDLVTAAQPRCARPGCEVGADSCDIHHRIPWPVGATAPGNLDPDCRRDHLLVTHGGWRYEQDDSDRSRTWTTSTGHRYTVTVDGEITLLPRPARRDDPPPF